MEEAAEKDMEDAADGREVVEAAAAADKYVEEEAAGSCRLEDLAAMPMQENGDMVINDVHRVEVKEEQVEAMKDTVAVILYISAPRKNSLTCAMSALLAWLEGSWLMEAGGAGWV